MMKLQSILYLYYRHIKELNALKESDPDLYNYFLKEDPELLNFEQVIKEDKEREKKEVDEMGANIKEGQKYFTMKLFRKLVNEMVLKKSFVAFRHMIIGFRSACKITYEEESEGSENPVFYRYKIPNVKVFNQLISWCIKNLQKIFDYFLPNQKAVVFFIYILGNNW